MTISYLSGNRIQGLSTDIKPTGNTVDGKRFTEIDTGKTFKWNSATSEWIPLPDDRPIGSWIELGRTKLNSVEDTISVPNLPNKRYYMTLLSAGTPAQIGFRYNADTGSNYARRSSGNGASDGTVVSQAFMNIHVIGELDEFHVTYHANLDSAEKLMIGHGVADGGSGVGNDPDRNEYVGKWANTSDAINEISVFQNGANDFDADSELVVLGWDESDTHKTNFWEDLGVADLSGGESENLVVSFTPKKYLWVKIYCDDTTGATSRSFRAGDDGTLDGGNNYARRRSTNGAADVTTTTSSTLSDMINGDLTSPCFLEAFILNIADQEKLCFGDIGTQGTAGAANGVGRQEFAGKWVETTNQINALGVVADAPMGKKSFIKVWGHD